MRNQIGLGTVLSALLLTMLPASASASPGNSGQADPPRSVRAQEALAQAKGLFRERAQDGRAARRTTDHGSAEHATLVLRDLALSLDDLDGADLRLARRILARPTDGAADPAQNGYIPGTTTDHRCSDVAKICVHWVTDPEQVEAKDEVRKDGYVIDGDAPNLDGAEDDGVPAWVEQNLRVFEQVWHRVVDQLGYRAPLEDSAADDVDPNGFTDIYLAELGQWNMYGYCTLDAAQTARRSPGYCVLDDDFLGFGASPENSLRATAAHEFFHAVQFAYDVYADYWVMEGTAAWVEDEVYDHINDNLQYLEFSALAAPATPLDYGDLDDPNWLYGSWIWWRFLTEYFSVDGKHDPYVIRQVWERLAANGPAERSLEAVGNVLARRGTPFRNAFAEFGAMNRIAQRWYAEGRSYGKYVAAPAGRFTLTKNRPGTGWKGTRLKHLSTQHAIVRPGKGLLNGPWQLRVNFDLPAWSRGSMASIVVHRTNGSIEHLPVRLSARGNARVRLPFNHRRISHVALSLTNASTRIANCGSGTIWSCGGRPLDDGLPFAFRARAFR